MTMVTMGMKKPFVARMDKTPDEPSVVSGNGNVWGSMGFDMNMLGYVK